MHYLVQSSIYLAPCVKVFDGGSRVETSVQFTFMALWPFSTPWAARLGMTNNFLVV